MSVRRSAPRKRPLRPSLKSADVRLTAAPGQAPAAGRVINVPVTLPPRGGARGAAGESLAVPITRGRALAPGTRISASVSLADTASAVVDVIASLPASPRDTTGEITLTGTMSAITPIVARLAQSLGGAPDVDIAVISNPARPAQAQLEISAPMSALVPVLARNKSALAGVQSPLSAVINLTGPFRAVTPVVDRFRGR